MGQGPKNAERFASSSLEHMLGIENVTVMTCAAVSIGTAKIEKNKLYPIR